MGAGPKRVVLRHRVHEAPQRAGAGPEPDRAELTAGFGHSDQAHLVRDFTAAAGAPVRLRPALTPPAIGNLSLPRRAQ
ncbi:hypothetical protein [Streptomyces sp. NPDC014623]|uniref:hypothetical protein n=1 Tax=Streptomyces sp. NPDC014623 TaxID=3364875 RepID=UPI0037000C80